MSGYVSKPIDQGELLSVIGRVLGHTPVGVVATAPARQQDHAVFDDLLEDFNRMTGS